MKRSYKGVRIIGKQKNPYYQARIRAAEFKDALKSMEGAADALGVHYSTIASYELGTVKCPAPDKVVLMADLYNAPELLNYYCTKECPIGDSGQIKELEVAELDRLVVKTLARLRSAPQIKEDLLVITEDGEITPDEESILEELLNDLDEISAAAQELKLWARRRMRRE